MSVLYSWAGTMEVLGWAGSSGDNKQTDPARVHTRPPRRRPFLLPRPPLPPCSRGSPSATVRAGRRSHAGTVHLPPPLRRRPHRLILPVATARPTRSLAQ
ncbi:hypothetical protein PVAP13_3NG318864 [Panicum virgatum]|uniref:Uncharacterized protein n=1 Tax=Panicum virgatum TaxID=38727 RepID=A0A8T0UBU5_PANVG|nr:hypothetical protein PVAP13_3NG318864 [Panicum virgatum]